jgi:hypothetical protein
MDTAYLGLVLSAVIAAASGLFAWFLLKLLRDAREQADLLDKTARQARDQAFSWQKTATERSQSIATLQESMSTVRQDLQTSQNSTAEQLILLRQKDDKLARLSHEFELKEAMARESFNKQLQGVEQRHAMEIANLSNALNKARRSKDGSAPKLVKLGDFADVSLD